MLVPITITERGKLAGWATNDLWINGVPGSNEGMFYVNLIGPNTFRFTLLARESHASWRVHHGYTRSVGISPYYFEFADPYVIAGRV